MLTAARSLKRLSLSGNEGLVGELPGCFFEVGPARNVLNRHHQLQLCIVAVLLTGMVISLVARHGAQTLKYLP